jgi:hypothetical protein
VEVTPNQSPGGVFGRTVNWHDSRTDMRASGKNTHARC